MKIKKPDDLHQRLQNELKKVFMGFMPTEFAKITPAEVKAVEKLVTEQGVFENNHHTNYVTLIQSIGGVFSPRLLKDLKKGSKAKNVMCVDEIRSQCTILISSIYHEQMQEFKTEIPLERKIQFGILIRRLLTTFKDVYQIELMHNQDAFIQQIDKNNAIYRMCIDIAFSIPESEFKLPEVSEVWKYSPDQLAMLAEQLCEHKLVDNATRFLQAFCNDRQVSCDWLKSTTSFMYLMFLIYKDASSQEWSALFELLSQKFTFKQEKKTAKMLRETLRNIGNITQSDRKYLSVEYATVYDLHTDILTP